MTSPLLEEVGYLADGAAVEAILAGTYIIPADVDGSTRKFIVALRMPEAIRQLGLVSTAISLEDHKRGWRRQKEGKASEPSGLSFAHYKTALYDEGLCDLDLALRSMPIQVGFIPDLWKIITDVEILKKDNVFDVDKMRLIQLMMADYQINNKLFGRRMIAHGEKACVLSPDQYGSRKFHRAILACLNKLLLVTFSVNKGELVPSV
jgi:hypothetical protein